MRGGYVRRTGRVALLNTVGSGLTAVAAAPVLIRLLGLEGYGSWALVMSMAEFAGLVDMGVGKSLAIELARTDDPALRRRIAGRGFGVVGIVSAAIVGGTVVFTGIVGLSSTTLFVVACGLALGTFMLAGTLKAVMEGVLELHRAQALSLVETLALYGGTVLVAAAPTAGFELPPAAVLLAPPLIVGLIQVTQWPWLRSRTGTWLPRPDSVGDLVGFVRGAGGLVVLGAFNAAFRPLVRTLFFATGGTLAGHAILDVTLRVARASYGLLSSLSLATLGVFAQIGGLREPLGEATKLSRELLKLYLVLGAVGILLGPWGFELLTDVEPRPWLVAGFVVAIGGNAILGVTEPIVRAFMAARIIRPLITVKLVQLGALSVAAIGGIALGGPPTHNLLWGVGTSCLLMAALVWLLERRSLRPWLGHG
jgi:hypothetical protein